MWKTLTVIIPGMNVAYNFCNAGQIRISTIFSVPISVPHNLHVKQATGHLHDGGIIEIAREMIGLHRCGCYDEPEVRPLLQGL